MKTFMTTAEKLYKTTKELPEQVIAEVLDFAEYLRQKMIKPKKVVTKKRLIDLAGGLESSDVFAGDPLKIQKDLRDEWG